MTAKAFKQKADQLRKIAARRAELRKISEGQAVAPRALPLLVRVDHAPVDTLHPGMVREHVTWHRSIDKWRSRAS